MPWKECSVMDERVRFVGRLLDGEKMVALCREFAISRKTGYKIFDRYKEYGLEALTDRSRRPWRYANQLPQQVEARHSESQTGKTLLGRAQDPRTLAASLFLRGEGSGAQHHPRRARSPGPTQGA